MSYRGTGRASVNVNSPVRFGVCDRCGCWANNGYNNGGGDYTLTWQYDYRGNSLTNLQILVCPACLDKPFEFFRPIIVGPDPLTSPDARPEFFDQIENPHQPRVTVQQLVDDAEDGG